MRKWITVSIIAACCGTACVAQTDVALEDSEAAEDQVAVTQAAITNGNVASPEDFSGILALQVYSQSLQSWATFCTATLMTNTKAITAEHCADGDGSGRQVFAKMGSQRIAVTGQIAHPDLDVAVIKLATPMRMWNWNNTGFLTNPAQITTTGYGRPAYNGTNASLDGAALMCFGYGGYSPSRPQPPLTYALLPTTFRSDRLNPLNELHTYRNSLNQLQEPGDSGGPCLTNIASIGSPLAYVQSGCFPTFGFCYGPGAESWAGWAYLALVAHW